MKFINRPRPIYEVSSKVVRELWEVRSENG